MSILEEILSLRNMRKLLPFIIVFAFILGTSSCSVTKRQHRSGYHISWNKKVNSKVKKIDKNESRDDVATLSEKKESSVEKPEKEKHQKPEELIVSESKSSYEEHHEKTETKTSLDSPDEKSINEEEVNTNLTFSNSKYEEEPEEEYRDETLQILLTILGVFAFIILSPIILVLGFLVLVLISESGISGLPYETGFIIGIIAAFFVFWLGTFGMLVVLFRHKKLNPSREEKNRSLTIKALISGVLSLLVSAFIALVAFF